MEENKFFEGVIGQTRAKRELNFYLTNHLKTGKPVPNFLFEGSKGDGKSFLARKFARNLPDVQNPAKKCKTFYPLNGGSILNPTILMEDILSKLQDEHCTVFIDEAHGLPKKVQTVLLTILEPNKQNRTRYTFNDVEYEFDFNKITFIFATTESEKIFHALKDRLQAVTLEAYNEKELAEIITANLDGQVEFEGNLLAELAHYVRRNARSATMVAKNVLSFGVETFTEKEFDTLKKQLSMFPHGVIFNEVRLLQILESDHECSLGHLASRLAQTSESTRQIAEPYLISLGLMEIDGKRRLTGKGSTYLKELRASGLI